MAWAKRRPRHQAKERAKERPALQVLLFTLKRRRSALRSTLAPQARSSFQSKWSTSAALSDPRELRLSLSRRAAIARLTFSRMRFKLRDRQTEFLWQFKPSRSFARRASAVLAMETTFRSRACRFTQSILAS